MKKQPKRGKKLIPPKGAPAKKPASPPKDSDEALPKQHFLKRLIFGEEKPDLSEIEAGDVYKSQIPRSPGPTRGVRCSLAASTWTPGNRAWRCV